MTDSPPLRELIISEEEWNERVARGRCLNRAFFLPIEQVQQSEWTHWKSLEEWGYAEWDVVKRGRRKDSVFHESDLVDAECSVMAKDAARFFEEHGYETDIQKPPWEFRKVEHSGGHGGVYPAPGETRLLKKTGANFQLMMNFKDPAKACILVKDMWSPRYKALRLGWNMQDNRLFPKLERFSDLMSLLWYHTMGEPEDGSKTNVTSPKYFVMPCIAFGSTNTRSIMERAYISNGVGERSIECRGEYRAPWPGLDLVLGDSKNADEAFLALLGSKHGEGPARMLTQHKEWFGKKRISKIKLWTETTCSYNLLFEVAAVEGDTA